MIYVNELVGWNRARRGAALIVVKSIDIATVSLGIYFILTVIALITINLAPITTAIVTIIIEIAPDSARTRTIFFVSPLITFVIALITIEIALERFKTGAIFLRSLRSLRRSARSCMGSS